MNQFKRLIKYKVILIVLGFSGMIMAPSTEYGTASYYADKFHGRKTANGELYHKDSLTAAHRTIPFGKKVKVTNLDNKETVIVIINDRGPHIKGRIIDLSRKAMEELSGIEKGIIQVKIEVLDAK